jgi:hypothetical protein
MAARLDMALHAELSPLGFERIRARRWVAGTYPPIRRIFEFQPLKGDQYSGRWGFSLDFVPIFRSGKLRWKRTSKSAAFDLCIDPIDTEGGPHDWCSLSRFIFPSKTYDWSKVSRTVTATTQAAQTYFDRVKSIDEIVSIFRERSTMTFRRFSLENHVQTHIAWGLCLIALGQRSEGETHLDKYCGQFSVDRHDRILDHAVQEAVKVGGGNA